MVREYPDDAFGPKKMTKKSIRESCRKNKLYLTPHLNDVLYLHYSGFNEIESLEEYVGLKCLWLECNAISIIAGLDNQSELRCLYLHNNLIKKIENLEQCKQLDTLNLSHNHITRIENCGSDVLPVLNTLNISHNYLRSTESVEHLRNCDFLSVLDISHNRIEDISVVKVLADMKALRVLTMTGNPVVNDIPSYRKTLILECKNLTYLDQRPVFDKDRACAEAWKRGGYEEERKEHIRWKKEEQRKIRRSINATLRLRHRGDGEPELLKTSSDEEHEGETAEETAITRANELLEITFKSNEDAWQEMENLFREASIENPKAETSMACALDDSMSTLGAEDAKPITKQTSMMCALKNILSNSANDEVADTLSTRKPKKLIEEISSEEDADQSTVAQQSPTSASDGVKKRVSFAIEEASEVLAVNEQNTEVLDHTDDDIGELAMKEFIEEITSEAAIVVDALQATVGPSDTEPEDTLNIVIEEKAISITLDAECNQTQDAEEALTSGSEQMDTVTSTIDLPKVDLQESNTSEDNSNIGEVPPLENVEHPENGADTDAKETGDRKYSIVSSENLTGSDSEPTNVTGYEKGVRSSSITITSGTDSSDSGDMFDKIVPKKHRKLASIVRSESSTSATESDGEGEVSKKFPSVLERQNTITEFIDEYKRFFRAVDVRDTRGIAKNRNKLLRPQTAKTKRTEPIVYEGVLKSMERNSNQANIDEAKRTMAKETVFDRLLKGHGAVDMDLEQQAFSIGGKKHDFQEYRLQVFRKDQEKLQSLIDRVTAQKECYNANIDSIHEELSTIMDDYDHISAKLQRVDDMLQNIREDVSLRKTSNETVVEQIVANLTTPTDESEVAEAAADEHGHDEPVTDSEVESNHSSTGTDDLVLNKIADNESYTSLVDAFKSPRVSAQPMLSDSLAGEISSADPVYKKFLEIQHEIDQLTDDDIFCLLTEAAGELSGELEQTQMLNTAVDAYWQKFDDVDQFRQHINLNAHPIIQRFRRFIECQCTEMDPGDGGEVDDRIASWENAYRKYERRLSNQMFDEYKLLSRQASIATTLGGESSAAELELLELGDGTTDVGGIEMEQKVTAWHVDEPSDGGFEQQQEQQQQQHHETNDGELSVEEELEDVESKPIEGGEERKESCHPSEVAE